MPSFNYNENCRINNTNLEDSYKELEKVLSNHKNQADEIDNQFNNINNHIDNLIENTKTRFNDAYESQEKIIDKKNEEFDAEYKSQKEFIDKKNEELEAEYNKQKEFIDDKQKEYIKKIEGYHSNISELSEQVAGDKISTASNNNADQEKNRALNWNYGTVFVLIVSIALLCYISRYFLLSDNEISYILILHKITITLPLLILVLYLINYCAKQSNHHLEKEAYYRDFAVKVKSIDPYIESLSNDKKEELKYEVARELFMSSSSDKVKENKKINEQEKNQRTRKKIGVIKI